MSAAGREEFKVRWAEVKDCSRIVELIKVFQDYQGKLDRCKITVEELQSDLFGDNPVVKIIVAESSCQGQGLVGFASFYFCYSSSRGKGLYLEDFFLTEPVRSKGLGKRLLSYVSNYAIEIGCFRIDFDVFMHNTPALAYYKKHGAVDITETDELNRFRINKQNLEKLILSDDDFKKRGETINFSA